MGRPLSPATRNGRAGGRATMDETCTTRGTPSASAAPTTLAVPSTFTDLTSAVIVAAAGYLSLLRGYRPARYYVVAWTLLLLSAAVLGIADAADSLTGRIIALVLGNALVIALEGLVVGIQTTRLVLFEFFIRFLRSSARSFKPLPTPDDEEPGKQRRES